MLLRWFRKHKAFHAGMLGMVYAVTTPILTPTLKSSEPAANEELGEAPDKISLTFAAVPSAERSTIELFLDKAKIETASPSSGSNNMLSADIRDSLKPGRYTVRWRTVCLCSGGHVTQGSFNFTVKDTAPKPVAAAAPAAPANGGPLVVFSAPANR